MYYEIATFPELIPEPRSITIDFEKGASTGGVVDDLEPLAPTIDDNDIDIDDEFHIVKAATVSPMFLMDSGETFKDHTTDTGRLFLFTDSPKKLHGVMR